MTGPQPEPSTPPALPPRFGADREPAQLLARRRGRNRTKADIVVYRSPRGDFALKDYAARPWPVRNTLGRWLLRRECRAYRAAAGLPGLPAFLGRHGPFALAVEWIEARPLSEHEPGRVEPACFERLAAIVEGLHRRGVALADLKHRDVLLGADGRVFVVDLAAAWLLGQRPWALRRALFERFCAADRFAVARLRARYTGQGSAAAIAAADPRMLTWHRRARRIKWCWDRLRGAPRLPPTDDHWRFRGPPPSPSVRIWAGARLAAVYALVAGLVAFARPTPASIWLGCVGLVLGLATRLWAAGHLVKNATLVTSGPYGYVRNPLYLGRLLIFTGLCAMASLPRGANWLLLLGGWTVFFGYYMPRKERVEPARLGALHGAEFERYRREVPSLVPWRGRWPGAAARRWSAAQALQNREHWMIVGVATVVLYLLWRARAG